MKDDLFEAEDEDMGDDPPWEADSLFEVETLSEEAQAFYQQARADEERHGFKSNKAVKPFVKLEPDSIMRECAGRRKATIPHARKAALWEDTKTQRIAHRRPNTKKENPSPTRLRNTQSSSIWPQPRRPGHILDATKDRRRCQRRVRGAG